MNEYMGAMRRVLASFAIVLSVLLMPLGMAPVAAAQAHSTPVATMEHCPDQGSNHDSNASFARCALACASVLPAAGLLAIGRVEPPEAPVAVVVPLSDGLLPTIETPPPRAS